MQCKAKETKKIRQNPENGVAILSEKFSWLHFIYNEPKCV